MAMGVEDAGRAIEAGALQGGEGRGGGTCLRCLPSPSTSPHFGARSCTRASAHGPPESFNVRLAGGLCSRSRLNRKLDLILEHSKSDIPAFASPRRVSRRGLHYCSHPENSSPALSMFGRRVSTCAPGRIRALCHLACQIPPPDLHAAYRAILMAHRARRRTIKGSAGSGNRATAGLARTASTATTTTRAGARTAMRTPRAAATTRTTTFETTADRTRTTLTSWTRTPSRQT